MHDTYYGAIEEGGPEYTFSGDSQVRSSQRPTVLSRSCPKFSVNPNFKANQTVVVRKRNQVSKMHAY